MTTTRDRAAEAAYLKLGASIYNRAREIGRAKGSAISARSPADLDAKIAALPAPAQLPSMPVAFALRRAAFGPVSA